MDTSEVKLPDVRHRGAAGKGSGRRKGDNPKQYAENAPSEWNSKTLPCGHSKIKYLKVVNGGERICLKCEESK